MTVVLLAMSIVIVLAGTLAQVDKGIWQVTDEYFRTSFAWIDFRVFFPAPLVSGLVAAFRAGFRFPAAGSSA